MATKTPQIILSGLPLRLVKENLLPTEIAEEALLNKKVSFVSYIVQNRHMDGDKLALIAAQEFGIPLIDIRSVVLRNKDDNGHFEPLFPCTLSNAVHAPPRSNDLAAPDSTKGHIFPLVLLPRN